MRVPTGIGLIAGIAADIFFPGPPALAQQSKPWEACQQELSHASADHVIAGCAEIVRKGVDSQDRLTRAVHKLCDAYSVKGDYDRAIEACTESIRRTPVNAGAFANRCAAHSEKLQTDEAIADCTESLRINPNSSQVFNSRCWARAIAGRELEKALSDCNKSLQLTPHEPHTLDSRGFVYLRLGRFEEAILDYYSALALQPKLPSSLYGRGIAEYKSGELLQGETDISDAKKLDPNIVNLFARYGVPPIEPAPQSTAQNTVPVPIACHIEGDHDRRSILVANVTRKSDSNIVRTGDPIDIHWAVSNMDQRCTAPLYLVLSTENRVRFEGNGFIALLPGAPGPFGIRHALQRTRVFVPLHGNPRLRSGSLKMKVYQGGNLTTDWALVEIPKYRSAPRVRSELAAHDERVFLGDNLTSGIRVVGGNPTIVIRDQFAIGTPKKVVESNSGEFRLEIYDQFYRVLDRVSSELILERAGWDPNFSPSSRFLGAYAEGPGLEVLDLYSGQVIVSQNTLYKTKGFRNTVHLAAWTKNDAFLALSIWGWGGIAIEQTLIDGGGRYFTTIGCHICQGFDSKLIIDLDASIVAAEGNLSVEWESLVDHDAGTASSEARALIEVPKQPDEPIASLERRGKIAEELSSASLSEIMRSSFSTSAALLYQLQRRTEGWQLGEPLQLSHHCSYVSSNDTRCRSNRTIEAEAQAQIRDRGALRVNHKTHERNAPSPNAAQYASLAFDRVFAVQQESARGKSQNQKVRTVWERLEALGLATADPTRMIVSPMKIDTKTNKNALRPILNFIPSARRHFKDIGDLRDDDAYSGLTSEASLIAPKTIEQGWTWGLQKRHYALIHAYWSTGDGATSQYWLFLIQDDVKAGHKLIDLSSRLKYKMGRLPSGLDSSGEIEITDEHAGTYGFGSWPATVDRVSISFGRYLLMSGSWLRSKQRWALIFDLNTEEIVFFNRDMPQASSVTDYAITADIKHLIQVNGNGEIYFYRISSGSETLRGYDVDGEIVVFDSRGYYASTPEGAHYVFLKFPGQPGYNSFHQFAKALDRKDVIADILEGIDSASDPRLIAPPIIAIISKDEQAQSSGRSVSLRLEATSTLEMQRIRIFVDGRLAEQIQATGIHSISEVTLRVPAEARWISVDAVDTAGFESAPRVIPLETRAGIANGRLFAISVGTDSYADKQIGDLKFATFDAKRFADTIEATKGQYYRSVTVARFYDDAQLATGLLEQIRVAKDSTNEGDTIMLFVAGHGFKDKSGQFFLATRKTELRQLAKTALEWTAIADALKGAKARVIVFLDACHAGAVDEGTTNDDLVGDLIGGRSAIAILAASKGRQNSLEFSKPAGGAFTTALVSAIKQQRSDTDTNGNGAIELSELYNFVKRQVSQSTNQRQTPWLARNDMLGEIPLF